MSEAFTFDDVEPGATGDFDELPTGTYVCVIDDTVPGVTSTDKTNLRVQFKVVAGDLKGRTISDWLYFTAASAPFLLSRLTAAGVDPPKGIKTADEAAAKVGALLIGRHVEIVVRPDEYPKGSGEFNQRVKAWKPAPEALRSAPVAAGVSAGGTDDDIPF